MVTTAETNQLLSRPFVLPRVRTASAAANVGFTHGSNGIHTFPCAATGEPARPALRHRRATPPLWQREKQQSGCRVNGVTNHSIFTVIPHLGGSGK